MGSAVYVKVDEGYTATVYSIEELAYYCKWSKTNPATLQIESASKNQKLGKEVAKWIESFKAPIVTKGSHLGRRDTGDTTFSYKTRIHAPIYLAVHEYSIYYNGVAKTLPTDVGIDEVRRLAKRYHSGDIKYTKAFLKKGYDY